MIDVNSVDMQEFKEKFEQYLGLNETKESINHSMGEIKADLANLLGVNKKKMTSVIKMLINMRQEGQPLDEDLATGVKELYLKAKETDDV
jgi:hypothetical protein